MRNTNDSTKLLSLWLCNSNNLLRAKMKSGLKLRDLKYMHDEYRKKPKILRMIFEENLQKEKKGLEGLRRKFRKNMSAKSRDVNGAMGLRDPSNSTSNSNIQNSTNQNLNIEIPNHTMTVHH